MSKGFCPPDKKLASVVEKLKAQLRRREEENIGLSEKIDSVESENEALTRENSTLREIINRAKNISPIARPTYDNVRRLAARAGIGIVKAPGGWVVKMASRIGKKFKRLRDIWLILTQEDWHLHDDFFPKGESIPLSAPAPALAPTPLPPAPPAPPATRDKRTTTEHNQIEVLRAEWRLFPSMREAIEEKMAEYGISPTHT